MASGAAAVIRAFWCGLAGRKGQRRHIRGRRQEVSPPHADGHDWQGGVSGGGGAEGRGGGESLPVSVVHRRKRIPIRFYVQL